MEKGQIVFVDTPGIHKAKNKLGEYMVNVAEHTLSEVDVILWLVEPSNFVGAGEQHIIEQLKWLILVDPLHGHRPASGGQLVFHNVIYNFLKIRKDPIVAFNQFHKRTNWKPVFYKI